MPKTKEQSEELIMILQESGLKPRSYGGRGMGDRECVGVSADSAFEIGRALAETDFAEDEPDQDTLGRRYIFYWPSYPWPKASASDEA